LFVYKLDNRYMSSQFPRAHLSAVM